MSTNTISVPADVANAIAQASATYGIPQDILYGIWHNESGASYPNPFVNSAGYGGLFGISQSQAQANGFSLYDPNTALQQADVAASVLASNIARSGGNIAAGLLHYSGNGYSSVPGQVSSGILTNVQQWPFVLSNIGSAVASRLPGQVTSTVPDESQIAAAIQGQTSQQGQVSGDLSIPVNIGPYSGNISIPGTSFLGKSVERAFWLLVGILLIVVGLWLMVEGNKSNAQAD